MTRDIRCSGSRRRLPSPCRWSTWRGLPAVRRHEEAQGLATEDALRAFDLARGPVLRTTLLRLAGDLHVAIFNMHHIVSDGWSLGVLVRELGELYAAFHDRRKPALPDLPAQYADFAIWQRSWLSGPVLDAAARLVERAAGGGSRGPRAAARPPAAAGADIPRRPGGQDAAAGARPGARRAGPAARAPPCSWSLLAAFQALLSRVSGQEDVVVGTPVANRTRVEIEGLIGFFVNTLALRADLRELPPSRELSARLRERALGAYAHQDLPFERLVEELQPERSLAHSPLFQVMFDVQQSTATGAFELPGLILDPVFSERRDSGKFDLALSLGGAIGEGGLGGVWEYNPDLFDTATIRRLAGHFEALIAGLIARPDALLSELSLLNQAESHQLRVEWNDTAGPEPKSCVHEIFSAQARRTPDAVALVCAGEELTYGELDWHTDRLAAHLQGLGVGRGALVGLCVERVPAMVIGLLGALKSGGSYLPLDPGLPRERLAFLLADAGVKVLLIQESVVPALPASSARVVRLDTDREEIARAAEPARAAQPLASLAYVIYTSGSTGQPKGAMVEHGNLAAVLQASRREFGWSSGDAIACLAPFSFDIFLFELLNPLLAGGTCHLLPLPKGEDMDRLVETLPVLTRLHAVPALMQQIVETARRSGRDHPRMRTLFVGGDTVPPDLLVQMREVFPAAEIRVLYGPTEATIIASSWRVPAGETRRTLIGRPLENATILLCDRDGNQVPIGVAGEIWIGGRGVTRGYLRREDLTAERYVARGGDRHYRTGDLARRLPSGEIEFLGRIDHQVKIRGFRIELGEIEAALLAFAELREAVVVVLERSAGGRSLAAFVVPGHGAAPDPGGLLRALRGRLPEYMVPAHVVVLPALPVTANGKVDRRALAALDPVAARRTGQETVRTPVEELLSELFAEVLRVERVGLEESFFDLGGHSLLATRLAARVRDTFGVEAPLRTFFENPTVSGLAGRLGALLAGGRSAAVPALTPVPRGTASPLSFAQERLWFLAQLDPGSAAYVMPAALRLSGRLVPAALAAALTEIVRRHQVLRTSFRTERNVPVQLLSPAVPVALPAVDLSGLGAVEREVEARRLATEEAARPFDLAAGPLFRSALLLLAQEEHVFLATMHHIASDGWSIGVFLRELGVLYEASLLGVPSPLAELPVQYSDFAAWQRSWISGSVLAEQIAYWRHQLQGAPPLLELPAERPRPAVQTYRGAVRTLLLPAPLTAEIRRLARARGATTFMVLLTALEGLFVRATGQTDLVIGAPIAGRTRSEIEGLIGFFLNTLALRTDFSGDPSWHEALDRVRETTLAAYARQDSPFERILEELQPERSLAHTPLFQVMVNGLEFEHERDGGLSLLRGLRAAPFAAGEPVAKFDLEVYAFQATEAIRLDMVYNRDLFGRAQMDQMAEHLEALLRAVTAAPDSRLSEIALLPPAYAVLGGRELPLPWPPESGGSIGDRFAAMVAAHPQRIAVWTPRETWTYAELAEAARRVAWALLARSPQPPAEERIALLFRPGGAMAAAVLGTLIAGKTYVPLDPSYPRERLSAMLADSAATAVVGARSERELATDLARGLPLVEYESLPAQPAGWTPLPVAPEAMAYLLYTSGSTGQPKGVMQSHRNVLAHIRTYSRRLGLGAVDRLTLLASYSFDAAVMDLFGALLNGAELCPWDVREEGVDGLAGWLAEREITVFHSTPTLFRALLGGLRDGGCFPALRLVVLGGEEARRQDLAAFRRFFAPGCVLVNGMGPTESTLALQRFIGPGDELSRPGLPVGFPVDETGIVLRHPGGEQASVWGIGEIFLRTPYAALGYWRLPEVTAEAFVPDPRGQGGRLYRTGDLGRLLPDGALEFIGRRDLQVKIRGVRVELGEVEAALASHPAVREAVVLALADEAGETRLAAYVIPAVADESTASLAGELRGFLSERLPAAMIPSAFAVVPAFPLTPTGKVDRRALGRLAPATETAARGEDELPRGGFEQTLAALWGEVLGKGAIGRHNDFFALGGHSLLAARLASRIREVFAVDLPLRRLFEASTLASLAAEVGAALREEAGLGAPPLVPVPRRAGEGVPLSFAQERLWFLDRLDAESAAYNIPLAFDLEGPVSPPALAAALAGVAARHETLRTTFGSSAGRPVQRIAATARIELPMVDLSALPAQRRRPAALTLAAEEAGRPFVLARGAVRARLLRLGDDQHVGLLTVHHIVSDGWSMRILLRETGELYGAAEQGRAASLPSLPVQYTDYAAWQREWLGGPALERQLAWWRERLTGAPPVLDLPLDRPRPPRQGFAAARAPFATGEELYASLAGIGRAAGATPFMVLLGAFQALLQRVTGEDDLVVGAPVANRNRRETEDLIGLFVNTLALRGDLSSNPSFAEWLVQVRETALGAYTHQDLPFERLVEELGIERSLAHSPLFQVMLALQEGESGALSAGGWTLRPVEIERGATPFDLALILAAGTDGLAGRFEYRSDLFDGATVSRLAGSFGVLLQGIAEEPGRRISELPLLTAPELRQLAMATEPAAVCGTPLPPVHARFAAQAELMPEATALVSGEETLSYAELNRRANRLAHRLRSLGVGPESRVGLLAERSGGLVAGLLGIWKAGGAYLPLDPALPETRLAYMIQDGVGGPDPASPRVLVAQRAALEAHPGLPLDGVRVVDLDASGLETPAGDSEPPQAGDPGNLAYLIYTSGTTGVPKAVLVEHGSLAQTLAAAQAAFAFAPGDRMPCLAPASFDIFLFELLGPLLAGGASVLFGLRPTVDLALLVESLAGMTLLHAVPALMRQVAAAAKLRGGAPLLRCAFVGGDAVPSDLPGEMRAAFPNARVVILYGPTEGTIIVSSHEAEGAPGNGNPIGRPLPGAALLVCDRSGSPVPTGVKGEIWLGGPGVVRGYLHRQDLTAEKFVPAREGRWYRTGDLGRRLPSGELEFLGRIDQQVKVRGFRIELGEIEAVLASRRELSRAVVVVLRPPGGGEARLAACVVPQAGEPVVPAALEAHLREALPEYMIPSSWIVLDQLPLTAHGKVDRRALEVLAGESGGVRERGGAAPPRTPLERFLAGLWEDVLGEQGAGVDDDFFALGGNSIRAAILVNLLQERLGEPVRVVALFEAPTLALLARFLEEHHAVAVRRVLAGGERGAAGEAGGELAPIARMERTPGAVFPLSFAQERLWFLERLEVGGGTYNIPLAVRLTGRLDRAAFGASLSEIVRRHEVLRTVFHEVDGTPVQAVLPGRPLSLPLVDLSGLAAGARESEMERALWSAARPPFDFSAGPLLRVSLIGLAEEEHVALVTVHHIASDGWSMGVLVRELGELYRDFARGVRPYLPELPLQYADFAVWQRGWLSGPLLERQLAWWREWLMGAPEVIDLPLDRPRPPVQGYRGAQVPVELPARLLRDLGALGQSRGATLFMVFLAAVEALLSRLSRQNDVMIGSPVANRNRVETQGLIGFFVNTLALRGDLSGDPSFVELLDRVRETTLGAYAHQDLPFEKLVEELRPERSLAYAPLFQVMLAWQSAPMGALRLPGLTLAPVGVESGAAKFDLTFSLTETAAGLSGYCEYDADLFEGTTALRLVRHLHSLLSAWAERPETRFAAVSLLSPAERHQIVVEWNEDGFGVATEDRCLHELFELQVARRPAAMALICGGERLSYAELDRRAESLARRLRARGVGPDRIVGLCSERSSDLVVGMLGILKAGGAYLPLDPSYPPERLAFMVEDADAAVLVATRSLAGRIEGLAGDRTLWLDDDGIPAGPAAPPPLPVAGNIAYLIYTSGSTGRPKGVAIEHRRAVAFVLWAQSVLLSRRARRRALLDLGQLRPLRLRAVRPAGRGGDRHPGGERPRPGLHGGSGRGAAHQHRSVGARRARARRQPAGLAEHRQPRRRAADPGAGGPDPRRGVGEAPLQPVWPDRGHGLFDLHSCRARFAERTADRTLALRFPGPCARRRDAAGPGRRHGGPLPGGSRPLARLSRASRPDGGPLRSRSVRRRRPPLPDRRSRAPPRGRRL